MFKKLTCISQCCAKIFRCMNDVGCRYDIIICFCAIALVTSVLVDVQGLVLYPISVFIEKFLSLLEERREVSV